MSELGADFPPCVVCGAHDWHPVHRGPVRDGPAALRRKRDNLLRMSETIRGLLREGLSEREVARRAVGREGPLTWFSRGRFSARNFVRAVAPGGRRPLW